MTDDALVADLRRICATVDPPQYPTCAGDPHSPYCHDWRRIDDDHNGPVYRCRDCGALDDG